jgi:hypothetical protein
MRRTRQKNTSVGFGRPTYEGTGDDGEIHTHPLKMHSSAQSPPLSQYRYINSL